MRCRLTIAQLPTASLLFARSLSSFESNKIRGNLQQAPPLLLSLSLSLLLSSLSLVNPHFILDKGPC